MNLPIENELSIIIPCYNEAERLGSSLKKIIADFDMEKTEGSLVIDGSTDRTSEVVSDLDEQLPQLRVLEPQRGWGKGASVKRGMLAATGKYLVYMDADLSTSLDVVRALVAEVKKGADMALASRRHPDAKITYPQPWFRELMGQAFNVLTRLLFSIKWRDTQCGCKCFRKEASRELFSELKTKGFAFDVELLVLAERQGLKVVEVPAVWTD